MVSLHKKCCSTYSIIENGARFGSTRRAANFMLVDPKKMLFRETFFGVLAKYHSPARGVVPEPPFSILLID